MTNRRGEDLSQQEADMRAFYSACGFSGATIESALAARRKGQEAKASHPSKGVKRRGDGTFGRNARRETV